MKKMLTDGQLCEVLSVTRPFLLKYRKMGMPCYVMGSRVIRYDLQEVLDWLRENGKGGEQNTFDQG